MPAWPHQPGYGGPPPPKKSNRVLWIVLGTILGVIALGVGGCVIAAVVAVDALDDAVEEAADLVTLDFSNGVPTSDPTSCEVIGEFFDTYDVEVTVTNESGVTSAYRVDYELFDPDGQSLGIDFGVVGRVTPDASRTQNALGTVPIGPEPSGVTCETGDALRITVN